MKPGPLYKLALTGVVFALLLASLDARAVRIVRLQMEYGSDIVAGGGFDIPPFSGNLDLELYDNDTPLTVANFMQYVDGGHYDLTFFNRSIPGFVIQGGGVNNISSDPENNFLGDDFGEVIDLGTVDNEPGLSNVRGSVAMAKVQDMPDSATNEWFINLKDNSDPLDTDNGGFTVFGSVIDDGMQIADQVSTFPTADISFLFGADFSDLPVADYWISGPDFAYQRNLVMILTAREITRPVVRFNPATVSAGFDDPATTTGNLLNIELRNTGNEDLVVDSVDLQGPSGPFVIENDYCTGTLQEPVETVPSAQCDLEVRFDAVEPGVFDDSITVNYSSASSSESFAVTYALDGKGAVPGASSINTVSSADVGTAQVGGASARNRVTLRNFGELPLEISSISGLGSGFSLTEDCTGSGVQVDFASSCVIDIEYSAVSASPANATMSLSTNDPVRPTVDILLTADGGDDTDGVDSSIEMSAPNAGDYNADDLSDMVQNNVATLSLGQRFVSLVADDDKLITDVVLNDSLPPGSPVASFTEGNLGFRIVLPAGTEGSTVTVGLMLPEDTVPHQYYRYGPTTEDPDPQWYEFSYLPADGNGAQYTGHVRIQSPTGKTVDRQLVQLTLTDGGPGDDDLTADGYIIHQYGGVVARRTRDESGLTGYIWLLLVPVFMLRTFGPRQH